MSSYATDSQLYWNDEDSLCACFFKSITGWLSTPTGNLKIRSYKTSGRGPGATEKKLGADGIALVQIEAPKTQLSGFFLFQAKKAKNKCGLLSGAFTQCEKMLKYTAASYLLVLLPQEVKMAGAMAVNSYNTGNDPHLTDIPFVSFPRFIVEHILQGVMLEPMEKAMLDIQTQKFKEEISHILTIVGGNNKNIEEAITKVDYYMNRLDLDVNE